MRSSALIRSIDMIAEGYTPEGAGTGVGVCSPN
jgi:hypothetical protein